MEASYTNCANLEQLIHPINNNETWQRFKNQSTRSRKHFHLNNNQREENRNDKRQLRSSCSTKNTYDTANTVTTPINGVEIALYIDRYNKRSCREKPECPLRNFRTSTNLVYECTVHTRGAPSIYIRQIVKSFNNRYRNHVTSLKTINKRHLTSLAYFIWRLKGDKSKYIIN